MIAILQYNLNLDCAKFPSLKCSEPQWANQPTMNISW